MMAGMYARPGRRLVPWTLAPVVSMIVAGCGSPTSPTPPPPGLTVTCLPPPTAVSFQGQPATVTWPASDDDGGHRADPDHLHTCIGIHPSRRHDGSRMHRHGSAAGPDGDLFLHRDGDPAAADLRLEIHGFRDKYHVGHGGPARGFLRVQGSAAAVLVPVAALWAAGYPVHGSDVTMANEGWPGEAIGDGLNRLPSHYPPTRLRLCCFCNGANDLLGNPSSATTVYHCQQAARHGPHVEDSRRCEPCAARHVSASVARNDPLRPRRRGGVRARAQPAHHGCRPGEGATLVDLYTPMSADVKRYIGADGLHPTEAGFTIMAQTFAAVIQSKFELKSAVR